MIFSVFKAADLNLLVQGGQPYWSSLPLQQGIPDAAHIITIASHSDLKNDRKIAT